MRTTGAGGKGACTSSSKRSTNSARSSGLGMPVRVVRPASARATVVSNSDSMSSAGVAVAGVGEAVRASGGDDDHVAGVGGDRLETELELHRPVEHLEALLLRRVHMGARYVAVGRQGQLDLQALAAGLS